MRNIRRYRCATSVTVAAVIVLPLLASPKRVQAKDNETPAAVNSSAAAGQPIAVTVNGSKAMLADGTHVKLQLTETLSSNKSRVGDKVHYVVDEDVTDSDKKVLISKGAPATGTVTLAKGRGGLGRSGKLEFTCESVTAVDGSQIPLRGEEAKNGKGGKGSMVAVTLLISPLGLFMKGHNITVKQGTVVTAYVNPVPIVASAVAAEPKPAK